MEKLIGLLLLCALAGTNTKLNAQEITLKQFDEISEGQAFVAPTETLRTLPIEPLADLGTLCPISDQFCAIAKAKGFVVTDPIDTTMDFSIGVIGGEIGDYTAQQLWSSDAMRAAAIEFDGMTDQGISICQKVCFPKGSDQCWKMCSEGMLVGALK